MLDHLMQHFVFIEPDRQLQTALDQSYSILLILLSVLVAIMAAYSSFLLSERVRSTETKLRKLSWLAAGSVALGGGIWAMHFIGMLALSLPVAVHYDIALTIISVIPVILASMVVLITGCSKKCSFYKMLGRAIIMGSGIGLMHYMGMAAMHMDGLMRYHPLIFSASIVIAVVLSFASLWLKQWAEYGNQRSFSYQHTILIAAVVMGCAVSGMHYTGMAAVSYFPAPSMGMTGLSVWDTKSLAILIGTVVTGVLIVLMYATYLSRRLELMNKVQASEAQLHAVFDTVLDGIIIIDEQGIIESFNHAAERIFGYSQADVLNKPINMLMAGADKTQHDAYMHHYFDTGEKKVIGVRGRELQACHKDGSIIPIELAVSETNVDGRRLFVGSVRDNRWRKKAEEALERAKMEEHLLADLLRLALKSSRTENFLSSSLENLIDTLPWLQRNPAGAIFLTEDEGHGQTLNLVAGHQLKSEFKNLCSQVPFGKCLCGRAAIEKTIQFAGCIDERHEITYEGMEEHGNYNVPLLQGDLVLGVMELHLSHGHAKSEQEILFLQQVAEVISLGVSRRYASRALREAKEQAEVAAKAKTQFLATMSHEIRTPMNGVLGMLHLLGKTELGTRQKRFVDTAAGSGEMLITVINDILDFSKMEADKLELESIPFNPAALVEETSALMAKGAHEKGLEVIGYVEPGMPRMFKGDPTRLRQVLTNLLSNAIKFTEQGDIVLYISELDEGLIHFGVRDTGIGMSEECQKRLFTAFTQADSSHTRKYGGTGLGLAISQRLISAMGGMIRVASAPGVGSDFNFDIPLEPVEDHTHSKDRKVTSLLKQQRILIVDDNPINREVLGNILTNWGINNVEEAENGPEAIQILNAATEAKQSFDIILLDMQMPGMTGLEVAESIRKDKTIDGPHLVMLSSIDRQGPTPELDAWLTKPVRQSDLFNTLMLLLGEQTFVAVDTSNNTDEQFWFNDCRLLLVEDNFVNQEVANEILSSAGFTIDIRENGAEALQAVQKHKYDAVLMDIQMPVMDGLEASRKIRSLRGEFSNLPIIAMTAHALTGDSDKSLNAGMNAHVTKPIDPEVIFKVLSQFVTPDKQSTKPAAEVETSIADLPNLPGIDIADGLQRMVWNWTAYRRILVGFRKKHIDAFEKLQNYIGNGEWEQATSLAHTLKGSGGNIGAHELYKEASSLEQVCRYSDIDAAGPAMESLRSQLEKVINGLEKLEEEDLQVPKQTEATQLADPSEIAEILENLLSFMDSDLGEAQSSLMTLQAMHLDADQKEALNSIEEAMTNFDIDNAKSIVCDLLK